MVATNTPTVNVMPTLPPNLCYMERTFHQQSYVTTGGFSPGANDQSSQSLRATGVLIVDCDLIDYVTHTQEWTGSVEDRKKRLYSEFADEGARNALKAKHIDDVMAVIAEVTDPWLGSALPTYVVDSGWGLHLYFWLDKMATGTDIILAKTVNRALVERINAAAGYELADKSVHDTGTRIMRVVGSMNIQARVRAGLDIELPCHVISELSNPESVWELHMSTHGLGGENMPAKPAAISTAGSSDSRSADPLRLSGMIGWLSKHKNIGIAIEAARDAQNSDKDMALACTLVRACVPPVTVAMVIEDVREHPNKHDGTDYYSRTTFSAWSKARADESIDPMQNFRVMHQDALMQLRAGMSNVNAATTVAQYDPRLQKMLWVDERTRRVQWATDGEGRELMFRYFEYHEVAVPPVRTGRREFTDQHAIKLCQWIENVYGICCMTAWRETMVAISSSLLMRNPVVEHLELCNAETPADADPELLETWLLRAFPGLEDSALLRTYSKKWLIGGAARALDPGCFIKGMLVLVSGQSAGKTSMFRLLGGEFYDSPSTAHLDSKDSTMTCHYSWLLELEEMDFLRKNTVESIKKYLTTTSDKIRLPYGSQMETFHRPCFYAGTANRSDILADTTGNDRFWCVELPANAVCDFQFVAANRKTLLALAYRAWMAVKHGTDEERVTAVNLTMEERSVMREANRDFERGDAIETTVLDAAWMAAIQSTRAGDEVAPLRFSWAELTTHLYPVRPDDHAPSIVDKLDRATQGRITDLLQRAGFKYMQKRLQHDQSRTRMWYAPEAWNERYEALRVQQDEERAAGNVLLFPQSVTGAPETVSIEAAGQLGLVR